MYAAKTVEKINIFKKSVFEFVDFLIYERKPFIININLPLIHSTFSFIFYTYEKKP